MSSVDRLSALPVSILCHILSFLPTKLSVSTSILGRRWRFLWAHVPVLDFDFNQYEHIKKANFSDIINRVLLLHRAKSINTFRFSCRNNSLISSFQFETWVNAAIEVNVRNLDLSIAFVCLTPRLFTCKTLVVLILVDYSSYRPGRQNTEDQIPAVCIPSSGAIYLPSLKKLELWWVCYEDGKALNHLLSGCPVLEELIVESIVIKNQVLGCFNISSATIKRLTVRFTYNFGVNFSVNVNAPALEYFDVMDLAGQYNAISFSPLTMGSLIVATIGLYGKDNSDAGEVVKFLNCFYNVKCLKLSGDSGRYNKFLGIVVAGGSIVKFDNLIKLELLSFVTDWCPIIKFIEIADYLEGLDVNVNLTHWMEPKQVPMCLLLHTRIIRIWVMRCTGNELNLVRYLLVNAKVLERMEIYFRNYITVKEKSDALARISLFERGSKTCQLAFY